ncbi:MAG: AGE family epimerase/isomerase [Caulobacteraceae bacterium]|nr:MAG: AGE family epimerase/isomerase [Caulobacteraceae bacterium]
MPAPRDILDLRERLKAWLFEDALPLWWNVGTDHARGGFFEKLTLDGAPVALPRRTRVVARQVYVFAQAGRMGWTGPWREAVTHGLASLNGPLARPDGLFRFSVDEGGHPVDDSPQPYEQAFGLLALSAARQALGPGHGLESLALRTRAALARTLGRPDGGVHDDAGRTGPFRANPLMHLFEAALAWREAGDDGGWSDLAGRIARLAREHLIQPGGALPELFDLDWTPLSEALVEPGHQFEWGFLLLRHAALADNEASRQAARALIALAERTGVDAARGVALAALDQALQPVDRTARLWPQTERTRAGALLARIDPDGGWPIAAQGGRSLLRYLETPRPGLWFENLEPDGAFRDEPSPASSLYHLVGAIQALDEACLTASS